MILVTGGAGFIGSHLVGRLVDRQEDVRLLDQPTADVSHLPLNRVTAVEATFANAPMSGERFVAVIMFTDLAANPNLWEHVGVLILMLSII